MRAAPRARYFARVLLERNVALHRRHVRSHDVGNAQALERAARRHLRVALPRDSQQEPADEHPPKSADHVAPAEISLHGDPQANRHHAVGDDLSADGSDARGARVILGDAPNDRAQQAPAVERKSRNQIECGEHGVDPGKLAAQLGGHAVLRRVNREQPETGRQKITRHRARGGNQKFLAGAVGLARNTRDAAEEK